MSPIAELALILAVLFYLEGVRWVPAGTIGFTRRPWGGYAPRGATLPRPAAPKGFLLPGLWAPALERFITSEGIAPAAFDADRVRRRLRHLRPLVASVTPLSWLVAINMFVLGPGLTSVFGWALVLPGWLLMHVVLTVLVVRACRRAARELPGMAAEAGVDKLLPMVLYPPGAARFLEWSVAKAFRELDPLAVAAVLVDRDVFVRMARARLVVSELDPGIRVEIEGLLEREGVGLDDVLAAPARQADSDLFCPRCQAQYRSGIERCGDCRDETGSGLPLIHFPENAV